MAKLTQPNKESTEQEFNEYLQWQKPLLEADFAKMSSRLDKVQKAIALFEKKFGKDFVGEPKKETKRCKV